MDNNIKDNTSKDILNELKIALNNNKITPFQYKIYKTIYNIPKGYVTTYHCVANKVHCKSCRAVGQALKRNNFAPVYKFNKYIDNSMSQSNIK